VLVEVMVVVKVHFPQGQMEHQTKVVAAVAGVLAQVVLVVLVLSLLDINFNRMNYE
jgi:hypothetical protein